MRKFHVVSKRFGDKLCVVVHRDWTGPDARYFLCWENGYKYFRASYRSLLPGEWVELWYGSRLIMRWTHG